MNIRYLAVIVIFATNFRLCQSRRYDNFSLYSVIPIEIEHLKFLKNLNQQKYIDLVFWKRPFKLYEDVQLIVNPTDRDLFIERAHHYKLDTKLLLDDVQQAFDNQTIRRYHRLRVETFSWDNYHNLDDIYQWLADIALRYPSIVELASIGKSVEGRDIFALGVNKSGGRPVVIVEGGIHANEWIATEFITYLAFQLISSNLNNNNALNYIANKYNWYLIPTVNPDGFEYSHKEDRLWRKNRKNVGNGIGVDLNRNFDYSFGKHGTSSDPKDDNFCGPMPFSEPETKALAEFVMKKADNLKFYFSFHSYGQKIIIPYADRIKHVENFSEMEKLGKQAILKMYRMYRVKYSVGTTYDTLGLRISGNSASWVKKNHKVKYVFTFLLRDNGSYGYALPADQVLPTCKETLAGVVELVNAKPTRIRANLFGSAKTAGASCILFTAVFLIAIVLK